MTMNKGLIISGLLIVTTQLFGQTFGLKAGISLNDLGHSSAPSSFADPYKLKVGFHIGAYGQFNLSEKISILPEFNFTQRGTKIDYPSPSSDVGINLNYLEFPIIISYAIRKKFAIDLGPSFSYKLSAIAKGNGSSNNVNDLYNKDFDYGIASGLRFNLTDKFSIIGRYYFGLGTVDRVVYVDVNNSNRTDIKFHNRTIQVGLGYRLK